MAAIEHTFSFTTKDVMQDMRLTLRMPRSFTIRTKVACWLIGLAGRVMGVPCEVHIGAETDRITKLFDDINEGLQRGLVLDWRDQA